VSDNLWHPSLGQVKALEYGRYDINGYLLIHNMILGKIFVHPFNCYIHNMSKCRTTRLLIHLCLQVSLFVDRTWLYRCGSKHGRIRRRRWHRQRRGAVIELCYMWCIYVIKWLTIYCCEDYMDCRCDLCLELELSMFCCMCHILESSHMRRQPKHGLYIKIYIFLG
jgi:hypothetical protein